MIEQFEKYIHNFKSKKKSFIKINWDEFSCNENALAVSYAIKHLDKIDWYWFYSNRIFLLCFLSVTKRNSNTKK